MIVFCRFDSCAVIGGTELPKVILIYYLCTLFIFFYMHKQKFIILFQNFLVQVIC